MNKKLYENYLEGLEKGYWRINSNQLRALHGECSQEWVDEQYRLELSSPRDAIDTYNSEEFQEALKTWDKIKNSPLVKALA